MRTKISIFLWLVLALLSLFVFVTHVKAEEHRSKAVLYQFQKLHPCPSTGLRTGSCPNYVKDHVKALACGGADAVDNLQWQTVAEGKAKDRWELKECGK